MKIFDAIFYITHLLILLLFCSCEKNNNNLSIIGSLEPNGLKQKYFSEYDLQTKYNIDSTIVLYRFKNDSNITIAEFDVRIFDNDKQAIDGLIAYLQSISIVMYDDKSETKIGEECWWWSSTGNIQDVSNIVFKRYNLIMAISSNPSFLDLISIAKKIDFDIINKEEYIIFCIN